MKKLPDCKLYSILGKDLVPEPAGEGAALHEEAGGRAGEGEAGPRRPPPRLLPQPDGRYGGALPARLLGHGSLSFLLPSLLPHLHEV